MKVDDVQKWDHWNRHLAPRYPSEKVVQFVLRNFGTMPRGVTRILDLGCGSGANTFFLAREGFDVHSLDISAAGVERTLEGLERLGLKAKVSLGDAAAVPFPAAYFDAIICIGVLECAGKAKVSRVVAEIVRVLKPNGLGFLVCAASDDFRIIGTNELNLEGFERRELEGLAAMVPERLDYAHVDDYVTTYGGGREHQHDFLVTLRKSER